ncbi:MAG: citrate (Si)-synthase [bacterium]|nr:citrate (Si)-synthase [bacterium]
MSILHKKLATTVPALREERQRLLEMHGDKTVAKVTVRQVIEGMRGVPALVCDTSYVDPKKGLIIRGTPVAHLAEKLPEEVFFLMVSGELPTAKELDTFRTDLTARPGVPDYVWGVLEALPGDTHPMTMLSTAVMAMGGTSVFRERYEKGLSRDKHWEAALDDALNLVAVVPEIAGAIYRRRYGKGARIKPKKGLDWAASLAHMLGSDDETFSAYMRIATVVQSDHEGAHASALTAHTVGSVLSDLYYAVPAGWNALAGPLHGLASQVCVNWVLKAIDTYGGPPNEDQIREYARNTIDKGSVIPGYGHAVLRGQDPRYLAILAFGEKNCSRDDVFKTVIHMSRVIPSILMDQGKVKNPWPNVDAINGALFRHFGITEVGFYTVFFAAAMTLGFSAQYVLNRALNTRITRPRSVTTESLQKRFDA